MSRRMMGEDSDLSDNESQASDQSTSSIMDVELDAANLLSSLKQVGLATSYPPPPSRHLRTRTLGGPTAAVEGGGAIATSHIPAPKPSGGTHRGPLQPPHRNPLRPRGNSPPSPSPLSPFSTPPPQRDFRHTSIPSAAAAAPPAWDGPEPAGAATTERKLGCKWSSREDEQLRTGVAAVGECNWDQIALDYLGGERSAVQCSHRWQKVLRPGLVKGPWTREEDEIINR